MKSRGMDCDAVCGAEGGDKPLVRRATVCGSTGTPLASVLPCPLSEFVTSRLLTAACPFDG